MRSYQVLKPQQQEYMDTLDKKPCPREVREEFLMNFRIFNAIAECQAKYIPQPITREEWRDWAESTAHQDGGDALHRGYEDGIRTLNCQYWVRRRRHENLPEYLRELMEPQDYAIFLRRRGLL